MNQTNFPFNIRVYGVAINKNHEFLITDEFRGNMNMTKFVGGGLEFGEGTIDCIKREFQEELEIEINVIKHLYTTDFFQQSAFNKNDQIISIYYLVELKEDIPECLIGKKPFDYEIEDGAQRFRWIPKSEMNENQVTFPIDKHVIQFLVNN